MLPTAYQWLNDISPPNTIKEALKLYGVKEKIGPDNNPIIMSWATECNISGYNADSIPWCGLFVALVVKRANWEIVEGPLWARNWSKFGIPSSPALGDILVFAREGGGHVGFYVAEDKDYYHVIGGNQSDMVNIIRISKSRLIASRRPKWKIAQPASVKKYIVSATGVISTDES